MKVFFAEHASVLLQTVIFGSILLLLFGAGYGGGIFGKLKEAAQIQTEVSGNRQDFGQVHRFADLEEPAIEYCYEEGLYAQENVPLASCIKCCEKENGKALTPKILKVERLNAAQTEELENNKTKQEQQEITQTEQVSGEQNQKEEQLQQEQIEVQGRQICKETYYDEKTQLFCFPKSGIYRVTVRAMDGHRKVTVKTLDFAVNRRRI